MNNYSIKQLYISIGVKKTIASAYRAKLCNQYHPLK